MPINNSVNISGIGSIDLTPLENRLNETENELTNLAEVLNLLQSRIVVLENRATNTTTNTTTSEGEEMTQNWQLRTNNYTAQNHDRIIADCTTAGFSLTLPNLARYGDEVEILKQGTNTLTIKGNAAKINSLETDYTIATNNAKLHLVYKDSETGWLVGMGSTASAVTTPTPTPTPTPTGGYSTAPAGLLGATGMTQIRNTTADEGLTAVPDIGFDFNYFDANARSTVFVNANGAVQFNSSNPGTVANPNNLRGLGIAYKDGNVQKIFVKQESSTKYRIRFEGGESWPDTVVNRTWEVSLFADGTIQLVTGSMSIVGDSFVSNGASPAISAPFTLAANSSFVFTFVNNQITVRNGSYSM